MRFTGPILCLDLATSTGACVGDGHSAPRVFSKLLPSTGDNVGAFAFAFDHWMQATLAEERPGLVVFEAPILPKKTQLMTVRKLTYFAGHCEHVCHRLHIPCREGRKSSVSKHFAGNGRASKDDTEFVCRRYGIKVANDDEADAVALWAYSLNCYAPDTPWAKKFAIGPIGAAS